MDFLFFFIQWESSGGCHSKEGAGEPFARSSKPCILPKREKESPEADIG